MSDPGSRTRGDYLGDPDIHGDLLDIFDLVRKVSDLARISYTRQKEALGLGHAIYQAKDFAGDDPFAVLLADDMVDAEIPAIKQMMTVYEKYDAPVLATMPTPGWVK